MLHEKFHDESVIQSPIQESIASLVKGPSIENIVDMYAHYCRQLGQG